MFTMHRYIIILKLFAFVSTQMTSAPQAAGGDLDEVLKSIYGNPCKISDSVMGVCVTYYQCNKNGVVVTDGSDLIDIRLKDGPCPSYLDVCCNFADVSNTNQAIPEPQHKDCGWRNPEGVGFRTTGDRHNEAKFGEFPWMVAIIRMEPVNTNDPATDYINVYVGGGSLIHPSVVITAAHIIYEKQRLIIRAGEWDTQTVKEVYPSQDRFVKEVVVHKDFNRGNLFYDIALLFLQDPVELAPNVGVVCLPPKGLRATTGAECLSSGWGKDKFGREGTYQVIMKKVEIPVVDRKTCQNSLRKTRLGNFFELHTSFMCAGGEVGKDTCEGDGGSPLVCPMEFEKDRYMQSGIVAWGIGCGEDGTPGVYVDVSNIRSWVDNEVVRKGYDPNVYSFKA